jgi:hypothetical protein
LTSRSTVLNRGKSLTDRFRLAKLEKHEFEIEVKSLEEIDKARILHSRMWFSGLSREYLEVIVDKRRYWTIIRHTNFNPRLISFITDPSRFEGVPPSDYWSYIEETLENPIDVWEHVFISQLTDWSRLTVLLVVFAGGSIEERRLRSCYESLSSEPLVQNYVGDSDFDMGLRVLVGSVLNRRVETGNATLTLFNPSIADYVLRKASKSVQQLAGVMSALLDVRSLDNFQKLRVNGIVDPSVHTEVIRHLCKTKLTGGSVHPDNVICLARLCELALQHCNVDGESLPKIHQFSQAVSNLPECSTYLAAIAPILKFELENQLISRETVARLLNSFDASDLDREELEVISKISPLLPIDIQSVFSDSLRFSIVDYWQNSLNEEIVERDILGDFLDTDCTSDAEKLVRIELDRILGDYGIAFTHADRDEMMKYVDVGDIIYGNIKRSMHDERDDDRGYVDRGAGEIDDLFSFDLP